MIATQQPKAAVDSLAAGDTHYSDVRGSLALRQAIARLRRHTDLPLCIGFGIRTPEHAADVARRADGVVVGSALVDQIAKAESPAQAIDGVLSLCAQLAEGVRGARR